MKTGPYHPQDLTGAEIDTLHKLAREFPGIVEPGDLPSKSGCSGLVRRGLASYMYGGAAVCLPAGIHEYLRRSEMKLCARFTAFQLLGKFCDAMESEPDPRKQLDLMHLHADLIAKELVGRGIYEYTAREGASNESDH